MSAMLMAQVINALPGIGAQAWAMLQRYWDQQKFLTALSMPVGTTPAEVSAQMVVAPDKIPSVKTPVTVAPPPAMVSSVIPSLAQKGLR